MPSVGTVGKTQCREDDMGCSQMVWISKYSFRSVLRVRGSRHKTDEPSQATLSIRWWMTCGRGLTMYAPGQPSTISKLQRTTVPLFHASYSAITDARSPPQPDIFCAVEIGETLSPNITFIGEDRVSLGRARKPPPTPLSLTPTRT